MSSSRYYNVEELLKRINTKPSIALSAQELSRIHPNDLVVLVQKNMKEGPAVESIFNFVLSNAHTDIQMISGALAASYFNNQKAYRLLIDKILQLDRCDILDKCVLQMMRPLDLAFQQYFKFKTEDDLNRIKAIIILLAKEKMKKENITKEDALALLYSAVNNSEFGNDTEIEDIFVAIQSEWETEAKVEVNQGKEVKKSSASVPSSEGAGAVVPMNLSSDEVVKEKKEAQQPKKKAAKKLSIKAFETKLKNDTFKISAVSQLELGLMEENDSHLGALARIEQRYDATMGSVIDHYWRNLVGGDGREASRSSVKQEMVVEAKIEVIKKLLTTVNRSQALEKKDRETNVVQQAAIRDNGFLEVMLPKLADYPLFLAEVAEEKIKEGQHKGSTLYDIATDKNKALIKKFQKQSKPGEVKLDSPQEKKSPAVKQKSELSPVDSSAVAKEESKSGAAALQTKGKRAAPASSREEQGREKRQKVESSEFELPPSCGDGDAFLNVPKQELASKNAKIASAAGAMSTAQALNFLSEQKPSNDLDRKAIAEKAKKDSDAYFEQLKQRNVPSPTSFHLKLLGGAVPLFGKREAIHDDILYRFHWVCNFYDIVRAAKYSGQQDFMYAALELAKRFNEDNKFETLPKIRVGF